MTAKLNQHKDKVAVMTTDLGQANTYEAGLTRPSGLTQLLFHCHSTCSQLPNASSERYPSCYNVNISTNSGICSFNRIKLYLH